MVRIRVFEHHTLLGIAQVIFKKSLSRFLPRLRQKLVM